MAVKRVVRAFLDVAEREVRLLRESDSHTNVVRYYCTVQDAQFAYIALELCVGTLQDYVEREEEFDGLSRVDVLHEATAGLAHLHKLQIGGHQFFLIESMQSIATSSRKTCCYRRRAAAAAFALSSRTSGCARNWRPVGGRCHGARATWPAPTAGWRPRCSWTRAAAV